MAISNPNPQPLDVVIFQRDDANTFWGETHISGANLIFYIDSDGHVNADYSASFYTLFPPSGSSGGGSSGTTLITGGLYPITTSWSQTATLADTASFTITSSFAQMAATASYLLNPPIFYAHSLLLMGG